MVIAFSQSAYAEIPANSVGAVVTVNGVAEVTRPGNQKKLKPGDSLFAHDAIDVSRDGSMKVLLNDHSIIDIGPGTQMKIDHYVENHGADREVGMSVGSGTVRAAVSQKIEGKGHFKVKTPGATMGVRGTEFLLEVGSAAGAGQGGSKVTVVQGQVEVEGAAAASAGKQGASHSGGGRLVLGAGQQVTALPGAALPTKAVTLDSATLAKMTSSSKVTDNAFSRAITIASSGGSSSGSAAAGVSSGGGSRAPAAVAESQPESSSGGPAPASVGGATEAAPPVVAAAPPPVEGGAATLSDIGSTIATATAAPPPINPTQIGIAGTFSPTQTAAPVQTKVGGSSTLTIVVTYK